MFAEEKRPLILVTNDDGIEAKGIHSLVKALRGLGRVVVVAPDAPRSGHGCSFTCACPVVLQPVSDDGEVAVFKVSGTPVDCVKLAMHRLFSIRKPDLLVSGINHGANSSVCVVYSGTMGAVLEGCIVGIPSVGFSLCDHRADADFAPAVSYAREIVGKVLRHGMHRGVCLNINIPMTGHIKGVRVCRQADGYWRKEFELLREEVDKETFRVTGEYCNREPQADDTDEYYLSQGYISVVPTQVDLTAYHRIAAAKYLEA